MADIDVNRIQQNIEQLQDQNAIDFQQWKRLGKEIEKLEEKIKISDCNLNLVIKKIKADYESLRKLIIDENVQLQLIETFTPTFKNGWSFNENYCNEITKKNGVVYINCMLTRNGHGNDIECFKLPSKFNKGKKMYFSVPYKATDGTWATGIFYIGQDGNILITTPKITDRFPVNISFPIYLHN